MGLPTTKEEVSTFVFFFFEVRGGFNFEAIPHCPNHKLKQQGNQNHHLLIHRLLTSNEHSDSSFFGHDDITTADASAYFCSFSSASVALRMQYNLWRPASAVVV
ncbi:hypothetical protein PIB30_011844 [Stylosanthes scabra]|uniref:Uncharacterized protein n=1 Tax=Stylosanthes scabra TaxID=79078 RepID=A0ABU6T6U7_9FABA|nr:hypothetical protein [Stylosanthes scabra]